MPSSIETSGGKYDVVHMESKYLFIIDQRYSADGLLAKYAVEKYMNESGLPGASIYTGWYNFCLACRSIDPDVNHTTTGWFAENMITSVFHFLVECPFESNS